MSENKNSNISETKSDIMPENKMGVMEIKKLLITMSIPIAISMLVQALYNIVDSMFVARISNNALSAVSLCLPIQVIIIAVACGTGIGVNAWLSRYLGQKKYNEANQTALHGLLLALVNGLVFAILGILFSKLFFTLFTDSEEIIQMGNGYLRICTLFSTGVFVQITLERIMQATGNSLYNMIVQGVGALTNIILDPVFIFGLFGFPALGVKGAAVATVIGQVLAMSLGIFITSKHIKEIKLKISEFKFSKELLKNIYRIAFPAILMQSIMSFMSVFMNLILASFSVLAVSAFGIYFKLQQFVIMGLLGMSNALIPIISFNYGAKKFDRIHQTINFAIFVTIVIMLLGTLVFQLFPNQLLSLFDADESLLEIGIPALKTISLAFVFMGLNIILCSSFQAVSRPYASLVVTLLRQLILLIPMAYIFSQIRGLELCWWAFVITEFISTCISLVFLKKIKNNIYYN